MHGGKEERKKERKKESKKERKKERRKKSKIEIFAFDFLNCEEK